MGVRVKFPCFCPLTVFDLPGTEEISLMSYRNDSEAEFCISLVLALKKLWPEFDWNQNLGIISPYQEQVPAPISVIFFFMKHQLYWYEHDL